MKKYIEMDETNQSDEIYICRICLEEEDDITKLISPCRCDGSSKYVHIDCLNQWRLISQREGNEGCDKCMECKTEYIIRRNIERENIITINKIRLIRALYYFPAVITIPIYFTDQNYDFITMLDFGEKYPLKKCNTYYDGYNRKNYTACYPITVKGYLIEGDLGFGFFLYFSFILSLYAFFAFNYFFCKQRKWLKNPYRFYKKFGYCGIITNIIFTLNSFIIYYLWRFDSPMGTLLVATLLIPFQGVNVWTTYKNYTKTLIKLNNLIDDDDDVLPWSEDLNEINEDNENNGYDMMEIENRIASESIDSDDDN
jgi:hypothetical protein